MSDLVVVSHEHDAPQGVYRVIVGERVTDVQPVTDDAGMVIMEREPLLTDAGEPLLDENEEPVVTLVPRMEPVSNIIGTEDFVFADDDERWEGLSAEDIAAEQRRLVSEALAARRAELEEQERRAAAVKQMPGVGELL